MSIQMAAKSKRVFCNIESKDRLVFGYVRSSCDDFQIVFFPMELIRLFGSWLEFPDTWDQTLSDSQIVFSETAPKSGSIGQCMQCPAAKGMWRHCFGTDIITKGGKRSWDLRLESVTTGWILIGIIDTQSIKKKMTGDFSDNVNGGYAFYILNGQVFSASHMGTDFLCLAAEPSQQGCSHLPFQFKKGDHITMHLDLTQKYTNNANCGTLRYQINGLSATNKKKNIHYQQSDSDIAFHDINVNNKYKCAVAVCYDDQISLM